MSDGREFTSKTEPKVDVAAFLVRLAHALHTYGTPSHRTEEALVKIGERLGVRGQYLVTPTSILAAFEDDDEGQTVRLTRNDPGEADLQKLTRVHRVIRDVFDARMSVRAARDEIVAIENDPPAYGRWLTGLGFAAAGASAARFFGGGLPEILAAGVAGTLVGVLNIVGGASERVRRLLPAVSGIVAAAVADAFGVATGAFPPVVLLGSLIVLIPGLTLTLAMNELALGHVVSGSARLTGATITFLQLGFGVALGKGVAAASFGTPAVDTVAVPLPEWTLLPALAVTAAALLVLFRGRGRDGILIFVMCSLAYGAARVGSEFFGPELGVGIGAMTLGVGANVASRWLDQPSAIALVPAMILLVPGSLGLRSLQALMADDVIGGIETLVSMAIVAVALVSGLLLANILMTPRRLL